MTPRTELGVGLSETSMRRGSAGIRPRESEAPSSAKLSAPGAAPSPSVRGSSASVASASSDPVPASHSDWSTIVPSADFRIHEDLSVEGDALIRCEGCLSEYPVGTYYCLNGFCRQPLSFEALNNVRTVLPLDAKTGLERYLDAVNAKFTTGRRRGGRGESANLRKRSIRAINLGFPGGHADRYDNSFVYCQQMMEHGMPRELFHEVFDGEGKPTGTYVCSDQEYIDSHRWECSHSFTMLCAWSSNRARLHPDLPRPFGLPDADRDFAIEEDSDKD